MKRCHPSRLPCDADSPVMPRVSGVASFSLGVCLSEHSCRLRAVLCPLTPRCPVHNCAPLLCADCNKENEIKAKDSIACRECGHRILYKKRTTRRESPTDGCHLRAPIYGCHLLFPTNRCHLCFHLRMPTFVPPPMDATCVPRFSCSPVNAPPCHAHLAIHFDAR